jgi:hypothetical protein
MTLFSLLLIGALGYLLGSFPSGVVVVRVWTGKDLRKVGTGHTGGMNVRRVAGLAPAVLAVLGDAAKALVAVKLAEILGPHPWAVPVAATTVVIGHCWPLYTRFQGGMGLASAAFILLYLSPFALLVLVAHGQPHVPGGDGGCHGDRHRSAAYPQREVMPERAKELDAGARRATPWPQSQTTPDPLVRIESRPLPPDPPSPHGVCEDRG